MADKKISFLLPAICLCQNQWLFLAFHHTRVSLHKPPSLLPKLCSHWEMKDHPSLTSASFLLTQIMQRSKGLDVCRKLSRALDNEFSELAGRSCPTCIEQWHALHGPCTPWQSLEPNQIIHPDSVTQGG